MTLGLRYAVRSDVGLLREGNEDAAYAGPRLLAVADGMGGHAAGEVASRLVIASIAPLDAEAPGADVLAALHAALDVAHATLQSRVGADRSLSGMGTTLTALLWDGGQLGLMHVGDSRAYLLRGGALEQITHDHTYVQDLVDAGRITDDEAHVHPQRALLTRALDGRSTIEPDLSLREARAGDRWLLCTDGLSGVVTGGTIAEALRERSLDAAADRLVELALRAGGPDNVTVIVAEVTEVDGVGPPAPVLAGAATDAERPSRDTESAAGRAALAVSTGRRQRRRPWRRAESPHPEAPPGLLPEPHSEPPPRRRRRRPALALLAVLLIAVLGAAGWLWLRSQYYVGINGERVAIFRGVAASVGGVALHTVSEHGTVNPAELPQYERERLEQGISAATLVKARRVVDRLAGEVCRLAATPTPAASPAASPAATSPAPTAATPVTAPSPCPGTP